MPSRELGFVPWTVDGEWRHTEVEIGPEGCIEGTSRPLTGVLFAYADVVTGSPPSGSMNPTVDLQIRLYAPPRLGTTRFAARTLRLGRTLYVGEAEMRHELDEPPFGLVVATFVNQPVPFPTRMDPTVHANVLDSAGTSYQRLTEARRTGPGRFEIVADIHTPQGTVSGATLGRLAELAASDLFGGGVAVDELDVRFLNKVRGEETIRATATALGQRDGATTVRIEITDTGHNDRLVTYALAVCRDL